MNAANSNDLWSQRREVGRDPGKTGVGAVFPANVLPIDLCQNGWHFQCGLSVLTNLNNPWMVFSANMRTCISCQSNTTMQTCVHVLAARATPPCKEQTTVVTYLYRGGNDVRVQYVVLHSEHSTGRTGKIQLQYHT